MVLDEIIPFLTAFGLGSIVTAFIQSWLKRKEHLEDRNFEERKKAYEARRAKLLEEREAKKRAKEEERKEEE